MRIDFCLDFLTFDDIDCENFIKRVASNKIEAKHKRQTAIVINKGHYESLTIGSRQTPIRAYLYNKTIELKKTGKQYITDLHNKIFGKNKTVWRLEFSVLNPSNIEVNDGQTPNKYNGIDTLADLPMHEIYDNLTKIYKGLYDKYWIFNTANASRRKTHNETPLISNEFTPYTFRRKKYADKIVKRTNKMVLASLMQLNDELRNMRIQELNYEQVNYFVKSRNLTEWAEKKGFYIEELK